MQLSANIKKIPYCEFRVIINFKKLKVGLNPAIYRFFFETLRNVALYHAYRNSLGVTEIVIQWIKL